MQPDYPHKIFSDSRCQYFFLLQALAQDALLS
jgi:hypothetical protein